MSAQGAGDEDAGAGLNFEQAYEELEREVGRLESGELRLGEALASYERAVALLRRCYRILEQAEQRLELLVREQDGTLLTRELDLAALRAETARGEIRLQGLPPAGVQADGGGGAGERAPAPAAARPAGRERSGGRGPVAGGPSLFDRP
ncbi:MAG: hypothetical protein KatS3mg102_1104 [Planctomycetota bacterium]|nr:MAG: hypothetical protein KatS3mg102_1104 [Planctomycetota bacterium]